MSTTKKNIYILIYSPNENVGTFASIFSLIYFRSFNNALEKEIPSFLDKFRIQYFANVFLWIWLLCAQWTKKKCEIHDVSVSFFSINTETLYGESVYIVSQTEIVYVFTTHVLNESEIMQENGNFS